MITCLVIGNVFDLGLKIISYVFLTLIGNLLALSQVETLWSWSLRWDVSTSKSLCANNIMMPSANNINSSSLEQAAGRSLILVMKKRAPSIEFCGTSQICFKASDLESPIWTNCILLRK